MFVCAQACWINGSSVILQSMDLKEYHIQLAVILTEEDNWLEASVRSQIYQQKYLNNL